MSGTQEKNKLFPGAPINKRPAFQTYFEYKTKFAKRDPLPPVPKGRYNPRNRSTSKTSSSSSCPVRPARRGSSCVSSGDYKSVSKDREGRSKYVNLCAELKPKQQKEQNDEQEETEDKIISDIVEDMLSRARLSATQKCQPHPTGSDEIELVAPQSSQDNITSCLESSGLQSMADRKVSQDDKVETVAIYSEASKPDDCVPVLGTCQSVHKKERENTKSVNADSPSTVKADDSLPDCPDVRVCKITTKKSKECAQMNSCRPSTSNETRLTRNRKINVDSANKQMESTKSTKQVQAPEKKKTAAGPPRCYNNYVEKMKLKTATTPPTTEKAAIKQTRPFCSTSHPNKESNKPQFRTSQSAVFSEQGRRPVSCGRQSTIELRPATSPMPSRAGRDRRSVGQAGDCRTLSSPAGCRAAVSTSGMASRSSTTGFIRRETTPTVSLAQTNVTNIELENKFSGAAADENNASTLNHGTISSDESLLIKACPVRAEILVHCNGTNNDQQTELNECNQLHVDTAEVINEKCQFSKTIRSLQGLISASSDKQMPACNQVNIETYAQSTECSNAKSNHAMENTLSSEKELLESPANVTTIGHAREEHVSQPSDCRAKNKLNKDAYNRKSRVPVGVRTRRDQGRVCKTSRTQRGCGIPRPNSGPAASSPVKSSSHICKIECAGKLSEHNRRGTTKSNYKDVGQHSYSLSESKISSTTVGSCSSSSSSTFYQLKSNFVDACNLQNPTATFTVPAEERRIEDNSVSKYKCDSCPLPGKMVVRKSEEHESELLKIIAGSELSNCIPLTECDIRRRMSRNDDTVLSHAADQENREGDNGGNVTEDNLEKKVDCEEEFSGSVSGRMSSAAPGHIVKICINDESSINSNELITGATNDEPFCDIATCDLSERMVPSIHYSADACGQGKEERHLNDKLSKMADDDASAFHIGNDYAVTCSDDVTCVIHSESGLIVPINDACGIYCMGSDTDTVTHQPKVDHYVVKEDCEVDSISRIKIEPLNAHKKQSNKDTLAGEFFECEEQVLCCEMSDECDRSQSVSVSPRNDLTKYLDGSDNGYDDNGTTSSQVNTTGEQNDHMLTTECQFPSKQEDIISSSSSFCEAMCLTRRPQERLLRSPQTTCRSKSPQECPSGSLTACRPKSPQDFIRPKSPQECRSGSPQECRPGSPSPCRPKRPQESRLRSPSACRPKSPQDCRPEIAQECRPESPQACRPRSPQECRPRTPQECRPEGAKECRPGSAQTSRPGSAQNNRPGSPQACRPRTPQECGSDSYQDCRSRSPLEYRPESPQSFELSINDTPMEIHCNMRAPAAVSNARKTNRSLSSHSSRSNQSSDRQKKSETAMSARTVSEDRSMCSRISQKSESHVPETTMSLHSHAVDNPVQEFPFPAAEMKKQSEVVQLAIKVKNSSPSCLPTYRRTNRSTSPVKRSVANILPIKSIPKTTGSLIPTSCMAKPTLKAPSGQTEAGVRGSKGRLANGRKTSCQAKAHTITKSK